MVQTTRLRTALLLILGVALVALLGMVLHQSRQLAEYRRQQAAALESLHKLQEALRQHELLKSPTGVQAPILAESSRAELARRDATIQQLTQDLSQAQANITNLQAQLLTSNDERAKALATSDERYKKEQQDAESRLEVLQHKLDAATAEAQASRLRIAALEADNDKLRSDNNRASDHAAEVGRVTTRLQDLDRRRDAYLTSLIRRYHDITSQFQAMTGVLDSNRDPNASAFSGVALTRIQNAISLADDDLRQLSDLNDQVRQLEKKLLKK